MMTLTKPLKWHGGKDDFARKFVALMPPRCKNPNAPDPDDPGYLHYVEPFAGGLSVLLANNPHGISEVVNDLNGELTDFWKVLANEDRFQHFLRIVQARPFSEKDYQYAEHWRKNDSVGFNMPKVVRDDDVIAKAVHFFVACRQSLSGRMDSFTGITRTRARRNMNAEVSAWLTAVEELPAVHARLKRVLILNRDALEVIRAEDGSRTLFYLDPPYLHETRATTKEYGPHEMNDGQHLELLTALTHLKGRFMLSGYRSEMYDLAAKNAGWIRHDWDAPNNAAGGDKKRRMVERLWCNFGARP